MFNAAVSVLHTVAFPDLGEHFVENCLGIPKEHRRASDIGHLLKEDMKCRSAELPREQLQKNLQKNLDQLTKLKSLEN